MVLSINRPMKRKGSSFSQFRKRVPDDVLTIARGKRCVVTLPPERPDGDHIHVKFTIGAGIRFSLQTRDPALARQRNAAVTEQVERLFAELRAGPPPPQSLPPKQIVALAGEVYRLFAETLEDDPVLTADEWRAVERNQRDDLEWDVPVLRITSTPAEREAIRLAERNTALEQRYGRIVDAVLAKHTLVVDAPTRIKIIREAAKIAPEASAKLARNADGDYSPDQYAVRFPAVDVKPQRPTTAPAELSFADLQSRWEREGPKARRTRSANKTAVTSFTKHLGHSDASRVGRADVLAWKDALLAAGLSAKTINDGYLAHIRILFRVAKRNDLVTADPTERINVPNKKKAWRWASSLHRRRGGHVARALREGGRTATALDAVAARSIGCTCWRGRPTLGSARQRARRHPPPIHHAHRRRRRNQERVLRTRSALAPRDHKARLPRLRSHAQRRPAVLRRRQCIPPPSEARRNVSRGKERNQPRPRVGP